MIVDMRKLEVTYSNLLQLPQYLAFYNHFSYSPPSCRTNTFLLTRGCFAVLSLLTEGKTHVWWIRFMVFYWMSALVNHFCLCLAEYITDLID